MILIGYSGHSYIVHSVFTSMGKKVTSYCDAKEKENNPYNLIYLGQESSEEAISLLSKNNFFISIGSNLVRRNVYEFLSSKNLFPTLAIHQSAIICDSANINQHGVLISGGVIINALAKIGKACICNTGCIIEHECIIGDFVHIGPGAVLCGNVIVGENSFIGAGSVIRQGITIGKNVTIGAGSVVINNISDNSTVYGNPAKPKQ